MADDLQSYKLQLQQVSVGKIWFMKRLKLLNYDHNLERLTKNIINNEMKLPIK